MMDRSVNATLVMAEEAYAMAEKGEVGEMGELGELGEMGEMGGEAEEG